jgi:hypothetical protein
MGATCTLTTIANVGSLQPEKGRKGDGGYACSRLEGCLSLCLCTIIISLWTNLVTWKCPLPWLIILCDYTTLRAHGIHPTHDPTVSLF